MLIKNTYYLFYAFVVTLLLFSCDEDDGGNACSSDFDQSGMFANVSDNIILPGYEDLETATMDLESAVTTFVDTDQSITQLENVRTIFKSAYLKWQKVALFQFGPAEMQNLRPLLNNFPVDNAAVEDNISSGTYDLSNISTFDKGFPALDYLLYLPGATDQEIVNSFSVDTDAAKRKEYLRDLVSEIHSRVEQTLNGWQQGAYRDEFINNTGTDAGSSLSLLINGLNEFYEDIRRDKIGIPSGIQDLGFTSPDKVEAVYSGISIDLLRTSIEACQRTFNGGSGSGLDDYLDAFNAEKNGEALSKLIKDSFTSSISSLEEIDGTLAEAVDNDQDDVRTAYTEISRQVIQLKTDMPAVMCVAITYIDNPSDSD